MPDTSPRPFAYLSDPAYRRSQRELARGNIEGYALPLRTLRERYPGDPGLAREEHEAFARYFPPGGLVAPSYYLYKKQHELTGKDPLDQIEAATTPADIGQVGAALRGSLHGAFDVLSGNRPRQFPPLGPTPPIYGQQVRRALAEPRRPPPGLGVGRPLIPRTLP